MRESEPSVGSAPYLDLSIFKTIYNLDPTIENRVSPLFFYIPEDGIYQNEGLNPIFRA
jgi:hypothetical protein